MRPNVDIPWPLHGHVREYAEDRDLSIEEGYIELIESAIDSATLEGEFDYEGATIGMGAPVSGQKKHISTLDAGNQPVYFFSHSPSFQRQAWMDFVTQPVRVEGAKSYTTMEDLRILCERTVPFLNNGVKSGEFSIRYPGGMWVGSGIDTFYETLASERPPFGDADTQVRHPRAIGIYVAPLDRFDEYPQYVRIITILEYDENGNPALNGAGIAVVLNGYPVGTSGKWYSLLDRTGGIHGMAQDFPIETVEVGTGGIEPTVVERLTGTDSENKETVVQVMIENPWYGNREAVSELIPDEYHLDHPMNSIPLYDMEYLLCAPDHYRDESEQPDYTIENIELQMFYHPTGVFSNVKITAEEPPWTRG